MSSGELENCLTCFRRTENFLRITAGRNNLEDGGEDIGAVFGKHFWFTQDEYNNKIVCTSCWEKIDDFNKFYCEVERVYRPKLKVEESDVYLEDVSGEPMEGGESFADTICKAELEDLDEEAMSESNSTNDEDSDESETSTSESDSDDSIPLSKRKSSVKQKRPYKPRKNRTSLDYQCHLCVQSGEPKLESFATWHRMSKHFKSVHKVTGYLFCCGRKFYTRKAYLGHTVNHAKIEKKRCEECDITFKDVSVLARHMELVHTPDEAKQFKCDQCSKAFSEEDLLNAHIKWHKEVETLNIHCAICNLYFVGQGNLEKHNAAHHTENTGDKPEGSVSEAKLSSDVDVAKQEQLIRQFIVLNCSQCDFAGDTFNELARHARNEHNLKSHPVVCCEKRFNTRKRLYEHCLKHMNPDWFKCDQCGKTFRDSAGLRHHNMWIHTPVSERRYKCDVCGDSFLKDYQLKQHTDRHLDKERKKYSCEMCTNIYTSMIQLKSHQQRVHGALSDWVCDVCAKGFAHRALLERHRLTHSEEGLKSLKVQCDKCLRWLSSKRGFSRHKLLCGNNSGPVKCDMCDHVSVHEIALAKHKKLNHEEVRKYACSYCGKEFKKQLRLKEHEANHAGIVLYKCPFCPRECNSSSNMYTHKKTAHAEQWAEIVAAKYSK